MRRCLTYTFLSLFLFSGCIEGPAVEQDLLVDIPDGKAYVIIRQPSFLDRTAEQRGMTPDEYQQYLLEKYGKTRSLSVEIDNGPFTTNSEIGTLEVQTIPESYAGLECAEIDGGDLKLAPGAYEVYDNEVTFDFLGSFSLDSNDYLRDCIVEVVSHE